ncbi:MAG TPA: hypothetical protein PKV71_19335 [Calditrichia bacterium]|nr:hypothetical protein [Calditrichia bacterium]
MLENQGYLIIAAGNNQNAIINGMVAIQDRPVTQDTAFNIEAGLFVGRNRLAVEEQRIRQFIVINPHVSGVRRGIRGAGLPGHPASPQHQ